MPPNEVGKGRSRFSTSPQQRINQPMETSIAQIGAISARSLGPRSTTPFTLNAQLFALILLASWNLRRYASNDEKTQGSQAGASKNTDSLANMQNCTAPKVPKTPKGSQGVPRIRSLRGSLENRRKGIPAHASPRIKMKLAREHRFCLHALTGSHVKTARNSK